MDEHLSSLNIYTIFEVERSRSRVMIHTPGTPLLSTPHSLWA